MNCQICGKQSGYLPLCKTCLKLKNEDKVLKCPICEKWRKTDEVCPSCGNKPIRNVENTTQQEGNVDPITCLICGENSNGKHFCRSCYYKYKDKIVYLQIKKCTEFVKLEAEYQSDFVCDDGHLVKSPYEKIIDNWLYKEGIQHAYEIKIDIDKNKDLTPDFYIPEYNGTKNIYIEFWGYDETNVKYQQRKDYKLKVYPELVKRDGITVIYLNKKEVENDTYKKKIKYADQGKINE